MHTCNGEFFHFFPCMSNFNVLSIILQKIWASLKFWDRRKDQWILMSPDAFSKAQRTTNIKYIPVLTFFLSVSSSSLSDGLLRLNPGGGGPLNPGGGGCSSFPTSPSDCVDVLPLYPGGAVDFDPGGGGILNLSFVDGLSAYNIRVLSKQTSETRTIRARCIHEHICSLVYILLHVMP